MFKFNPLYLVDGYKISHKKMLAPGTTRLYGTWIPRKVKYIPEGIDKVVSFGQQLVWKWLHDQFEEHFFEKDWHELKGFVQDMTDYLGLPYDGEHFKKLHNVGYLPMRVKALPEGIETPANIPHMTFVNTIDGFAWLTLYLETIVSAAAWKPTTSATLALKYRRNVEEWVKKTDPANDFLIPFMCHDFSARGLSPWDMITSGLGHATSFIGSDTLAVIPAARYYYGEDKVATASVNASEHSVTTTGLFKYDAELRVGLRTKEIREYYAYDASCEGSIEDPDYLAIAEWLNLRDWLKIFPEGILSVVSDTFDLWKLITFILPRLKDEVMARDGKLVIRPDSGDPVDIICGTNKKVSSEAYASNADMHKPQGKGVIELLWDIFGGTVNEQGCKVLDSHIGVIYGDSINLERQVEIYKRLEAKGFAATNIILGVGSFTYQYNSRDSLGFAAKGAWFEVKNGGLGEDVCDDCTCEIKSYNIYKDPATDNGTKKSLKGLIRINDDLTITEECTWVEEGQGLLQTIYEDGEFFNQTTLTEVRERINDII